MDWNFTYRGKRFRLGRDNVRDPGRSDAFRTFLHHQPDVVSERFNLSDFETLWYALRFSLRATEDASDTINGPEFKFRTHEAVYLRWRKKRMPAHMFFCETLCFLQRKAILTSPNRILDPKNFLGQPCDHQVRTCTYATTTWYCIVPIQCFLIAPLQYCLALVAFSNSFGLLMISRGCGDASSRPVHLGLQRYALISAMPDTGTAAL